MRFVFVVLAIFIIINWFIVILSGLFQENLYKKYGKQMMAGVFKFLLLLAAIYTALYLIGLSS